MSISPKRRRAIFAAHGGVCYYCGTADATHIDHIVPRACGGSDDASNLTAACLPCNLRKHRHRLPPEAEKRALAETATAQTVWRIWCGQINPDPEPDKTPRASAARRTVKINVMLTAEDVRQLEDAMIAERCRSMSAFARKLILGQMAKRRA